MEEAEDLDSGPFVPFTKLCWSKELLVRVEGLHLVFDDSISLPMLVGIRLTFTNTVVVLQANNDDSISVISEGKWVGDLPNEERSLADHEPWSRAVGRPLMWAWRMTNQRGYFDGIQMDFAETVASAVTRIQLICIAGELKHQKTIAD